MAIAGSDIVVAVTRDHPQIAITRRDRVGAGRAIGRGFGQDRPAMRIELHHTGISKHHRRATGKGDRIRTIAAGDHRRAAADRDHIIAASAGLIRHNLDQNTAQGADPAMIAEDDHMAIAGSDIVIAVTGEDPQIAITRRDRVGAGRAIRRSLGQDRTALRVELHQTGIAKHNARGIADGDPVIPGTTQHHMAIVADGDLVITAFSHTDGMDHHHRAGIKGAIGSRRLGDHTVIGDHDAALTDNGDAVIASPRQRVAGAGVKIGCCRVLLLHHGQKLAGQQIHADRRIDPEAGITIDMIRAQPTDDHIITRTTGDLIAEIRTDQRVIAPAAIDDHRAACQRQVDVIIARVAKGLGLSIGHSAAHPIAHPVLRGIAKDHQRPLGPAGQCLGLARQGDRADRIIAAAAMDHRQRALGGRADVQMVIAGPQHDLDQFEIGIGDAALPCHQIRVGKGATILHHRSGAHAKARDIGLGHKAALALKIAGGEYQQPVGMGAFIARDRHHRKRGIALLRQGDARAQRAVKPRADAAPDHQRSANAIKGLRLQSGVQHRLRTGLGLTGVHHHGDRDIPVIDAKGHRTGGGIITRIGAGKRDLAIPAKGDRNRGRRRSRQRQLIAAGLICSDRPAAIGAIDHQLTAIIVEHRHLDQHIRRIGKGRAGQISADGKGELIALRIFQKRIVDRRDRHQTRDVPIGSGKGQLGLIQRVIQAQIGGAQRHRLARSRRARK